MTKLIRYALATVCFAMSVGCLALWWRSMNHSDHIYLHELPMLSNVSLKLASAGGYCGLGLTSFGRSADNPSWEFHSVDWSLHRQQAQRELADRDWFWSERDSVYFPHWYAALLSAVAGAAVLIYRRQVTIRSAIFATTVVAGLLGMAVML